ncbi:hypothetical protein LLB_2123 [Legionella longbeachae D-4968]|nr:hypothetical protein LLB_2123 [Legionella longbeachae D-4968]
MGRNLTKIAYVIKAKNRQIALLRCSMQESLNGFTTSFNEKIFLRLVALK